MTGASITRRQWWARALLAAPLTTAAGSLSLWAMRNAHAVSDRLHWAGWVVALLGGFLAGGPASIASATLNNRILRAAGLPPFKTRWPDAATEANRESPHASR